MQARVRISERDASMSREILSDAAMAFLEDLDDRFEARRKDLLSARSSTWASGSMPSLAGHPDDGWRVDPAPEELRDRRVEIVVPAEPGQFQAALSAGANGVVADFEDALSPTWANLVSGQQALREYWAGSHDDQGPLVSVRVRGLHLIDRHFLVDGRPFSAALLDTGLYLFHNLRGAHAAGKMLHLCVPKVEQGPEAVFWADLFRYCCEVLSVPASAVKCSLVIETLPAIFQIDSLIHGLRDFVVGVHAGRWDYLFSFVKQMREHPDAILGDRARLGVNAPFLAAYAKQLVDAAHRRGVHAIGGNGTFVPMELDEEADRTARARVRQEKVREVTLGFDGTWVAHPGLVNVAREAFEEYLPHPNQLYRVFKDSRPVAKDLLELPDAEVSRDGLRANIRAAVRYLAAWLSGEGSVVIDNQLEHIGTAEIARSQLWQWLHYGVELQEGGVVTATLLDDLIAEEAGAASRNAWLPRENFERAAALLSELVKADEFAEFLTDKAYEELP